MPWVKKRLVVVITKRINAKQKEYPFARPHTLDAHPADNPKHGTTQGYEW